MVKKFRVRDFVLSLSFLGALLFVVGCQDDASIVGGDMMPKNDRIIAFSHTVVGITAANYISDPITTDFVGANFTAFLGIYDDPRLGKIECGFATEVYTGSSITTSRIKVDSTYVFDGLTLFLSHKKGVMCGNPSARFNIKVYKLNTSFSNLDKHSNTDMTNSITEIGSYEFWSNHGTDSIIAPTSVTYIDSIPLDVNLGKQLFSLDKDIINNRAKFNEFFKGIYVKVEAIPSSGSVGSLTKFDMWNNNAILGLDFHQIVNSKIVTHPQYLFPISTEGLAISLFKRPETPKISVTDTSSLYVQGMAGSCMNIKMPSLKNWQDTINIYKGRGLSVGFSNVELELLVDSAAMKREIIDNKLILPPLLDRLSLLIKDGTNIRKPLLGSITSEFIDFKKPWSWSYKFIIPNAYFLDIISGAEDFSSLIIEPAYPSTTLGRVIFKGAQNGGVVFRVKGTKYKLQ